VMVCCTAALSAAANSTQYSRCSRSALEVEVEAEENDDAILAQVVRAVRADLRHITHKLN